MAFTKFKDKSKANSPKFPTGEPTGPIRVRTPRDTEVLGKVEQRVGANRMFVVCFDAEKRNCRIPGRLRKKLWIREGDIVLVKPWDLDNTRGDVIFKYKPNQISWLEKKGFLKEVEDEF